MIKPVTVGAATLYRGDCREVFPNLNTPPDMVITDAPYLLTAGGNTNASMGGKFKPENYANDGAIVPCNLEWGDWMGGLYDCLATNADAYFMANDKSVFAAHNAAVAAGFKLHNQLVWNKTIATPNRWYMKNLEFILYCWKGRARVINDPGAKQLTVCPPPRGINHPTPKPVALMELYICQSSLLGQLVIDPFMGSGATGVAALRAGRRFVGCESNQEYFDLAVSRLEAEIVRYPSLMAGSF